ncbi:MAG: universal stress protein [Gemmatimonadota bacterium]
MSILIEPRDGPVDFVLHPTDLSEASLVAFHHALAIAIRRGAQLTLLHAVGRRATDNWVDFPSVRDTLAKWRRAGTTDDLEERIRRASISKREVQTRDPVAACTEYTGSHSVDMIVLATEGRSGISRLIRASRAERVAREAKLHTLFVPSGSRAFVDGATGEVSLRRILVPIDPATDPRAAMLRAVQSAALLDDPSLEITLLHVDTDGAAETPATEAPELPYCRWIVDIRRGEDVAAVILDAAADTGADAIYMSTGWHRPMLGRGAGGVTEAVLRGAPCPVAVVPV